MLDHLQTLYIQYFNNQYFYVLSLPVDLVLEAVLQRPALELGARLGLVGGGHHDLVDAPERGGVVLNQPDRLVRDHLVCFSVVS